MALLPEILSSRTRSEVFRILFGLANTELHLREIGRRSGLNIASLRNEMEKLTALDIVKKRIDGNRTYFSANRDHPLYPEIRNIVLKTVGMADLIRPALKERNVEIAFIYGSVAQGTESATSDLDLFVVGELSLREITSRLKDLQDVLFREINPFVITHKEMNTRLKNKDHFITSIMKENKIFIIGDKNELEKLGR